MRWRLIISYALVIFIALGTVLLVINLSAENQVKGYLRKGALAGVDKLVENLEDYYQPTTSWEGVEVVMEATEPTIPAPITHQPTPQATGQGIGAGSGAEAGTGAGSGQGEGPASGKGPGKGSGQGEQAYLTPAVEEEIIPTIEPTPLPGVSAPEAQPTTTSTQVPATATPGADILPEELDIAVNGKSGHILTDELGVIVYSPVDSEIGMTIDSAALTNAIGIVDSNNTVVGYLVPSGGNPMVPGNFESQLLERIQQATLIAALISGVIAIVLALILAQMILKPVKVLTRAAEAMAQGDLEQRVVARGKDEVATLGRTFNQMASSLKTAEEQRRSMTSDIAHELRTPLAVQQANLEALQDGIYPLTVANLSPVIEQNRLLTRLVDDLRTLALADSGQLSLNLRRVNLPELTAEIILRFEAAMATTGIQIRQVAQAGIPRVTADPERIAQIMHNLLQNAQRYTPANQVVDVNLSVRDGMAVVEVRDHGPGIPEDELERIFERFHRLEKGRERVKGGTGLGLAIARKLAEAHGGSLSASNHPEGGAVFTLKLPVG